MGIIYFGSDWSYATDQENELGRSMDPEGTYMVVDKPDHIQDIVVPELLLRIVALIGRQTL